MLPFGGGPKVCVPSGASEENTNQRDTHGEHTEGHPDKESGRESTSLFESNYRDSKQNGLKATKTEQACLNDASCQTNQRNAWSGSLLIASRNSHDKAGRSGGGTLARNNRNLLIALLFLLIHLVFFGCGGGRGGSQHLW